MEDLLLKLGQYFLDRDQVVALVLAVLLWMERRDKNREARAHDETRERWLAEYKVLVAAIDKISTSVDTIVAAYRTKGGRS